MDLFILMNGMPIDRLLSMTVALCLGLAALSCQKDVDLTNPFDPAVVQSKPRDLRMVSLSESSLSLAWTEDVHFTSPSQVPSAPILIEQSADGVTFSLLDSAVAGGNACTVNRTFTLNKTWYFRIYRRWGTQRTPVTNSVSSTVTFSSPSKITVASLDETKRSLTWQWQQVSEPAAGFRIERKTGFGGLYQLLRMTPGSLLAFTDTSVITTNQVYTYRICAVTAAGTSSDYDSVSVAIPLLPPNSISCSGSDSLRLILRWTNTFAYPSQAVVERSVGDGPFVQAGIVPSGQNTWVDSLVDKYHVYQYRVWLKTSYNASPVSPPVRGAYQATGLKFNRLISTGLQPVSGLQGTLSDDEQLFVSVGFSEISLVDLPSGQILRKIPYTTESVQNVALSRNKEWFARVDLHAATAHVYRIQDGQCIRTVSGAWPGIDVAISHDGSRLYTSFGGGDVSCWNIADSSRLWQRSLPAGDNTLWLLPDGERLLVGLKDNYFQEGNPIGCLILDARNGATLSEHPGGAFMKTPQISATGEVRIIEVKNGTCYNLGENKAEFTASMPAASYWLSTDRLLVAFVAHYEETCLYNVVTGSRIGTENYGDPHQTGWHKYTRMIDHDRQFIIYDQEGDIGFYDITRGWAAW